VLNMRPHYLLTVGILLAGGCAHTKLASRSTTSDKRIAELTLPASQSDDNESEPAPPQEADFAVEQTAHEEPASSAPPTTTTAINEWLTLNSLEQIALSNNPTLVERRARVDAASGRWLQVGLKPNPQIGYTAPEIGNEGTAGQQGAYLQQEFVTAHKLDLNRSAAAWDVRRAERELAEQQLRVLTDVRQGFYATLVAQERVKVAEELLGIAQAAVQKADALIQVQEPQTVLLQAEIEAELASVLVENSRVQLTAQWRQLAAVLGQPKLPQQRLTGELTTEFPEYLWEQTFERIRTSSPELAAAAAEVERSRWTLQRACVEPTPNVTVQAGAAYDYATRDSIALLQVSLPIPIHDRNQGAIAEARANIVAAERSVQRVELSLQERLASVLQQYEQARQQATRYEDIILPKAKRNLDLNQTTFEAGETAYLAVLTAQRSYSQARLAWLNALERLWSATVTVEGLLLNDSLKTER
jgi:outer membrane protein, heavy metal efflux system